MGNGRENVEKQTDGVDGDAVDCCWDGWCWTGWVVGWVDSIEGAEDEERVCNQ